MEIDCKWQRRVLDRPTDVDYTQNEIGAEVVIETAKLTTCPGCGRPGVATGLATEYGKAVLMIHKRTATGQPTEVCVAAPKDRPDLVMLDSDGNEQYAGPAEIPDELKN